MNKIFPANLYFWSTVWTPEIIQRWKPSCARTHFVHVLERSWHFKLVFMKSSKFPSLPAVHELTTRAAQLYRILAGVCSLFAGDRTASQVRSTWLTPNVRWRRVMQPVREAIYDAPSKRLLHNRQLCCKLRQGSSALEKLLLPILVRCPCYASEVSCELLLLVHKSSIYISSHQIMYLKARVKMQNLC